jgi:hypothetical protein
LTKIANAAEPHPLKIATYLQPPHPLRRNKITRMGVTTTSLDKAEAKAVHNLGIPSPKTEDAFRPRRKDNNNNDDHNHSPKDCHLTSLVVPRFCNVLINSNVNLFLYQSEMKSS